ncbi:hypothetical protein [Candidatus Methylacidithermus pantelleriae]|nr:hypothetical protein [Candidatus Methylacidithermus pantelleriae]
MMEKTLTAEAKAPADDVVIGCAVGLLVTALPWDTDASQKGLSLDVT